MAGKASTYVLSSLLSCRCSRIGLRSRGLPRSPPARRRGGEGARFGLPHREPFGGQTQLSEQHIRQLLGRVDVERVACYLVNLAFESPQPGGQLGRHLPQTSHVQLDSSSFHGYQHGYQGRSRSLEQMGQTPLSHSGTRTSARRQVTEASALAYAAACLGPPTASIVIWFLRRADQLRDRSHSPVLKPCSRPDLSAQGHGCTGSISHAATIVSTRSPSTDRP